MRDKLAAQLYTLRAECQRDFPGVLRACKDMGWAGVQISGLHGWDPREIAAVLWETGLGVAGMHVGLDRLQHDLAAVLAEAELFGTQDLVCPSVPAPLRHAEGLRQVRAALNAVAAQVAPRGYRVSYHNHAFEFALQVDGKGGLEYMLEPVPENRVLAEIDIYWVRKGGADPLRFMAPYAGRMPIIHLKDMTADDEATFAEVGTGVIDFPPILAWCKEAGVQWLAVEQDQCKGDPLESLRISLHNLWGMLP